MAEQITAVVDTTTNEFMEFGHAPDARYQVKPLSRNPHPTRERWHPAQEFETKTAQQIADAVTAQQTAAASLTSRQKDILATIAWAVRGRNVAVWTALTVAQKKSTVLAEADNWRDIRVFIEQNL